MSTNNKTILLGNDCKVTSDRCVFPFTHNGEEHTSCISLSSAAPEYDTKDEPGDFFCKINIGGKKALGKCNEYCLDDFNSKI
jgi:hypothetical protein